MADNDILEKKRQLLEKKRQQLEIQKSLMYERSQQPSMAEAVTTGLAQGLTLGLEDEISGVRKGLESSLEVPLGNKWEAFKLGYGTSMAEDEFRRNELREAYPKSSFAGEVVGGGTTGGMTFGLLNKTGLKNLPIAWRIPGVGAAEGAIYGAGMAPPGERTEGAIVGGLTGGVATPLALGATSTLAVPLRGAAKRLGDSLFGTPRDRAVKEIMKALDADDITVAEANQLIRRMGPNATIADLGDSTQRLGRTVYSEMGPAASGAKRFLDARQTASQISLRQAARQATGASSFDKGVVSIINGAESQAKPLYDEVFSEVLDVNDVMLNLLQRPSMKEARARAAKKLANEGFATDIVNDVTDVRYMDAVKRSLGDMERAAIKAGNADDARIFGNLRREFVAEIDNQVPNYAKARSIFAGEAAIRDAAELGRTMFVGRGVSASDAAELIGKMGESELQGARAGFLEWLTDELAGQRMSSNAFINKFTDVPKYRQMIQLLFPDQTAVEQFLNRSAALSRFGETRNIVTGGSQTALRQADRGTLQSGVMDVAVNSVLEPASALRSAISLIKSNTQITPEVLNEMGKILFNRKVIPSQALKRGPAKLFEIPKMPPLIAAGATGGAVGSQQESIYQGYGDPLLKTLDPFLRTLGIKR